MTWLAPWALGAGALGLFGVLAAHLLSRQRPRAIALATARFLPAGMLEATTVQRVPMDRWWMLLRMLIIALLALGAAQPVFTGTRVEQRTVLLLDRTLPVDAQRAALATLREGDAVIAFDTNAALGTLASVAPVQTRRASLSAALARLIRSRDSLARGAHSLHVAIASPFARTSLDPATEALRAMVPDSIRVLQVAAAPDTARPTARGPLIVRAAGDDPIAAVAQLLGDSVAAQGTIIERRDVLTADDSLAATHGATIVWWPARVASRTQSLQALTVVRTTWIAPVAPDTGAPRPAGAHPIAWWVDGSAAAWMMETGLGCRIDVRAALPPAGDHVLSLSAQAWIAVLVRSCERDAGTAGPVPAWLAPPPAVARIIEEASSVSGVGKWLVAAAIALAALELLLRRMVRA